MEILDWELERQEISLYVGNKIMYIPLTPLEYRTFRLYMDGVIHEDSTAIKRIYGNKKSNMNNFKEIIARLNKKIKPIGKIHRYYTVGYKFIPIEREKWEKK